MTLRQNEDSNEPRLVPVRAVPIELCQFIKFGGVTGSGGEAKRLIAEGKVAVNGALESRIRRKLALGDRVTVAGETLEVRLG